MALPARAKRGREPLSRERVLDAAMALADAGGIGSVSMRRVAQELGVEAMSLYHHVANKDGILAGLADRVVDEFELPAADAEWKAALRAAALSAYRVLMQHRWAANLLLTAHAPGPPRLRHMNALLGTLRRAGFSADETDLAYHALESHIMGFSLWVVGMNLGTREELAALAGDFLGRLPRDDVPHLVEHIQQHMKPPNPEEKSAFEFGLDLILDGLERLLVTGAHSADV